MLFYKLFYSIVESNILETNATFSIKLNENHPIYKGHFPNSPITPGVVQLEIIKELIFITTNKDTSLVSISNCKFLAILAPSDSQVKINIDFNIDENNNLKVIAKIFNHEKVFFKLNAIYNQSN